MVPIDKGVPMPADGRTVNARKYPWYEMEVGDSFLLNSRKPGGSASIYNTRLAPKFFESRKTAEGYRVWRTA